MSEYTLSAEDREFFGLVARAAFASPFSEERHRLDLRIGQTASDVDRKEAADASVARLRRRLDGLESQDLRDYSSGDRRPLERAILFAVFHDFSPQMDRLVERQLEAEDEPVDVPFSRQMLSRMTDFGIPVSVAGRRLSLLYQLRRAYYFLDQWLVGEARCMRQLRKRLWANIFTDDLLLYDEYLWDQMEDFSTFLVGPTGTGKGTAAAALGYSGWLDFDAQQGRFERSFTQSFLPINLSEFSSSLIESELFGHRKGAFTGAIEDYSGVFGRCHRRGVTFLDELGEVGLNIQVKLLRVLEDRRFTPVGGHRARRFDGRVVAATNQPVHKLRDQERFRDDLYYRLCSDIVELPSLRLRIDQDPDELRRLVEYIVDSRFGGLDRIVQRVLRVVDEKLPEDYGWPGNVRELEQCVRRVVMTGSYGGDERRQDGPPGGDPVEELAAAMDAERLEARELTAKYCQLLYERHQNYREVGRLLDLDRRTVKRYVTGA